MDTKLLDDIRKSVYGDGLDAVVERYSDTLAGWPGEPTGLWLRVSTGRQDEAGQLPETLEDCKSQGLRPVKFYIVHDKSAYKGEQQAKLDEMYDDVREGTITVLTMWDIDRLDRRGGTNHIEDVKSVIDAGGRLRAKRQGPIGLTTTGDRIGLFIQGEQAHEYSEKISAAVSRTNVEIRASNHLAGGGYAWGYEIVGEQRRRKTIRPTDRAREWVPQIFQRCIAGDSCQKIARWLDSENVPTRFGGGWSSASVHSILTNMTYMGRRPDDGIGPDGKPHRELRQTTMTCERVIEPDIFRAAQEALKSPSRKRGPGITKPMPNKPLLANLKCARCGSPMYRVKTGRKEQRQYYYRCAGTTRERRGCGNMVYLPALDQIVVNRVFMTSEDLHQKKEWVPGENWTTQLTEIEQGLAELPRKYRPGSAEFRARQDELVAQYEDYDNRKVTRGCWKRHDALKADGSVLTEGEYFRSLQPEAQREYLQSLDIRAEKVNNPPLEPGASRGARVIIDGVDHGTFPYPSPKAFR